MRTLGALLIFSGILTAYVSHALFEPRAFAHRVAASLEDDGVARYIAEQVTAAIIRERPDLVAVRPALLAGVHAMIGTATFRSVVQRGVREAHASLFRGSAGRLVVSLPDLGLVVKGALAADPALAAQIPKSLSSGASRISDVRLSRAATLVLRIAAIGQNGGVGLLVFGVLLSTAGVVFAPSRRRALLEVGQTWVAMGWLLMSVVVLGGVLSPRFFDAGLGALAAGTWGAFMGGLRPIAWGLVLVGLAFSAAVSSLEQHPELAPRLERLRRWIEVPPGGRKGRAARGLLLLAIGALSLLDPTLAARALAAVIGASLAFLGLRELFALGLPVALEEDVPFRHVLRSSILNGLTIALVLLGAVALVLMFSRPSAPIVPPDGCNGSVELCRRPLSQVVFPGTHNSMAAADVPDWYMPNQDRGIATQLTDGVRALLIDVLPGIPAGDRVRTELASESAARAKYVSVLGEAGVNAALRTRDRLVPTQGAKRQLYLCHGFCELGALRLAEVLETLRHFLTTHPGDVLLVIIQDEGVSAVEIAEAVKAAGLLGLVYPGPFDAPWPTLGELVEADTRLLLFVEHDESRVSFIPNAYRVFQETPYAFPTPESMSCAPNRGNTGGSLFLVNHWIEHVPPLPSRAAKVNTYDFLVARARRCAVERGLTPTILAVDFYRVGDLFRAARDLNGLTIH